MKILFYISYWLIATVISSILFSNYFNSFVVAWLLSLMIIPAVLISKLFIPILLKEKLAIRLVHIIYLAIFIVYVEYLCVAIYFRYLLELKINKIPAIIVNPVFLGMWLYFFISLEQLASKILFINYKTQQRNRYIEFISNRKRVKIEADIITYIASNDNEVWIHTLDSKYRTRMRISQWEKVLNENQFIRIHRSFIVNKTHVSEIKSNTICVDKNFLEFSRKYKDNLAKLI
jgi:hypothetical protein